MSTAMLLGALGGRCRLISLDFPPGARTRQGTVYNGLRGGAAWDFASVGLARSFAARRGITITNLGTPPAPPSPHGPESSKSPSPQGTE